MALICSSFNKYLGTTVLCQQMKNAIYTYDAGSFTQLLVQFPAFFVLCNSAARLYGRANSIFWTRALNIPLPRFYVFLESLDEKRANIGDDCGDSSLSAPQVNCIFSDRRSQLQRFFSIVLFTYCVWLNFFPSIICGHLGFFFAHVQPI